jgi:hypothetical protein
MKKLRLYCMIIGSLLCTQCEKRQVAPSVSAISEVSSPLDYSAGTSFCSEIYAWHSSEPQDSGLIRVVPEEIDLASDQQLLGLGSILLHFEEAQLQVTRTEQLAIIHYRPVKQEHVYRCFGDSVIIKTSARKYTTIQMSRS